MDKSFVHLHQHTEMSMLDGASKIEAAVESAVKDGQPAIGITDHGNMYGAVPFFKECKKQGVKPIIGTELYQALNSVEERPKLNKKVADDSGDSGVEGAGKLYYHLTALAENNTGYYNLIKLSSRAFIEGFHYKPRCDWDMLSDHSEGLIVTSGCLGGLVLQALMRDDYEVARRTAARFQDIFGRDNFFIEIQDHGIVEQRKTNPKLLELAKEINAPLLLTNDSHYVSRGDAKSHDVFLCQPPGTKVLVVENGHIYDKKIEDLAVGESVVSWETYFEGSGGFRSRFVPSGKKIINFVRTEYCDDLVNIETEDGKRSSYTKDHIAITKYRNKELDDKFIVYLMRKGDKFRIGSSFYSRKGKGGMGFVERLSHQIADDIWILDVFDSRHQALEEEYWTSWRFGIPTWSFAETKDADSPRTPYYASLWDRVSDLEANASQCLDYYGRDILYPFYNKDQILWGNRPQEIRACNLLTGMRVCVYQNEAINTSVKSGLWKSIKVSRVSYSGPVYSMDIEETETYVADGVLTHNCGQTKAKLSDPKRFKFQGEEHYLKTANEMRGLFPDHADACDNTLWIAERADVDIQMGVASLPHVDIPEQYSSVYEYLMERCVEGCLERYGSPLPSAARERLGYELNTVADMGFLDYFLIVADLVDHAKTKNIRIGPGRGSAAGSIIAYSLGITDIDPLEFGLLFERFLNPARVSMPDIDMDWDTRFRDYMVQYCIDKYGYDHVANIITYSTIKSRSAIRDTVRALDYPFVVGNKIVEAMPPVISGFETPLKYCFEQHPLYERGYVDAAGLRELYDSGNIDVTGTVVPNDEVKQIIDISKDIEGLRRQDGVHAAAVVLSDKPLVEYLPVQRKSVKDGKIPTLVTQYDMGTVDDLGLLKMDFLGLRNLDIISETLKLIKERHGIDVNIDYGSLDLKDQKTLELLGRAETMGIFQVESAIMRDTIKSMGLDSFDDLAALNALCRPGPMAAGMHFSYGARKNGQEELSTFHSDAEEILDDTYNLMIYQEQLMAIAQKFAGYSLGEGYLLLKACAKKKKELMAKEEVKFIQGCIDNGYGEELGIEIFNIIKPFASYSFNKSHAVAYGFISFQTAFLKAHYPVEYMSCLLTANMHNPDKLRIYLNECKRMGLKVRPPHINKSMNHFYPFGSNEISFGFEGIKFVGFEHANNVIQERSLHGDFRSFYDFCERMLDHSLNKKMLTGLIMSGAFKEPRLGLAEIMDDFLKGLRKAKKKKTTGQIVLPGISMDIDFNVPDIQLDKKRLLELEDEYLGLYVSAHPLDFIDRIPIGVREVADIVEYNETTYVDVVGVINSVEFKTTKKGQTMALINFQDLSGSADMVVFPRKYKEVAHLLRKGMVLMIEAKYDVSNNRSQFICEDLHEYKG